MKINQIAKIYASALLEEASRLNQVDGVGEELHSLSIAMGRGTDLYEFFTSPMVSSSVKQEMLTEALKTVKASDLVRGLILTLCERDRLALLPELASSFIKVSNQSKGRAVGTVKIAASVSKDEEVSLAQAIGKIVGKSVELTFVEDKQLLAGMVAEIDGWRIDDTVLSQFSKMREQLTRSIH